MSYFSREQSLRGQIAINESSSANGRVVSNFEDWLEIYNPTSQSVSLDGLYLETFDTGQKWWYFTDVTLKQDSCTFFCSGKDRKTIVDHYGIPSFRVRAGIISIAHKNRILIGCIRDLTIRLRRCAHNPLDMEIISLLLYQLRPTYTILFPSK